MYNSQYYTCEQIDERLLQGYLDDYNTQTGQSLTKAQFLTKLGSIFSKEGVIDNTATQIGYYECDTAAGTAAKTITVANYALFAGGSMKVKFANKNTANNATLNINSQGAKALYYQGERASATNSWDAEEVVEIYYDGTSYYANNVKGGSGSGVYDVSKEHPTSGPNSDGKFTIEYILNPSNVNELIPVNKRYPGMTIQFVSTSDNKYVQARCMAQNFTTDVTQWQGVDDEPTAGSDNLVKSEGVNSLILKEAVGSVIDNIMNEYPDTDDGHIMNYEGRSRTPRMVYKKDAKYIGETPFNALYYSNDTYQGYTREPLNLASPYDNTTHIILAWRSLVANIVYTTNASVFDVENCIHYHLKTIDYIRYLKEIYIPSAEDGVSYSLGSYKTQNKLVLYADNYTIASASLNDVLSNGVLVITDNNNQPKAYVVVNPEELPSINVICEVLNYSIQDNPYINAFLTKQDKLVSGTNIKTINGESILGNGNIDINVDEQVQSDWSQTNSQAVDFIKNKPEILTKSQIEAGYYTKQEVDESLSSKADIETLDTINELLSELTGGTPSAGAITGDNIWTGVNGFAQPITGVAGINDNNVALYGTFKNTLNRCIDVADYGASPNATASENVTAINNALANGNKTVVFSKPGTYLLNDTLWLYDNTTVICHAGVILKKADNYAFVFSNIGGDTRTQNVNIKIIGAVIDANNKHGLYTYTPADARYGCRGEIDFYHIKNVVISNVKIYGIIDYENTGIQLCSWENVIIENCDISNKGDAIHVNRGNRLVVRDTIIASGDDNIALNAKDWIDSAPEVGDITNVLIENCEFVEFYRNGSAVVGGNVSRHLVGAWVDWFSGMEVQRGDVVVSNGHTYMCLAPREDQVVTFTSQTQPSVTSGVQNDAGGFQWRYLQDDAVYHANIENVTYRNCRYGNNRRRISCHYDAGSIYDRGFYPTTPNTNYPHVLGVLFDGVWDIGTGYPFVGILDCPVLTVEYNFSNIMKTPLAHCVNCTDVLAGRVIISNVIDSTRTLYLKDQSGNITWKVNNSFALVALTLTGKIVSDSNVDSLPATATKGSRVVYNDIPYYYNGTSWISLIS